jgi:DNA-binding transcriptional ArsR family regulator
MIGTVEHAPDRTRRATRALSRVLFGGARYRIEIGAAIAGRRRVNTAELAAQLDIARQSVNQELRVLERAGLLRRIAGRGRGGEVFFMPQRSRYWRWCTEAQADAARMLERTPAF